METKTVLHDQGLPLEERRVMVFTTCSGILPRGLFSNTATSSGTFYDINCLFYSRASTALLLTQASHQPLLFQTTYTKK